MALLIKNSELPKLFTNIFSSNSVFVRSFLQSWWSIAIRRIQKSSSVDHSNIRSFIRSSVKAIIYIFLRRHPEDTYEGCCTYHGACLEGLASGPAIQGRYGRKGAELAGREDVWELESYYIGQAVADYMLTYSPEKIILWGGVMHQEKVFDMVRQNAVEFLNGYLPETSLPKDMSQYVVAPALGENPGIIGAMCLGMDAYLMECGKNL